MMLSAAARTQLAQLAAHHGVLTSYLDAAKRRRRTAPSALISVLRALGVTAGTPSEIRDALQEARLLPWQSSLEPVMVAWKKSIATARFRLSERDWAHPFCARLHLESGRVLDWTSRLKQSAVVERAAVGGASCAARELKIPSSLPCGYHSLEFEHGSSRCEAMLIVAPDKAYSPRPARRDWGVFLPAYALHSRTSWGAGDWGDLQRLCEWTGDLGGGVVSTLPMLSSFVEADPSPYSPVSRLQWNEFYLDLAQVPEMKRCQAARRLVRDQSFQERLGQLRQASLVDYRQQMQLKRQVLDTLARWFFKNGSTARHRALERFQKANPVVASYARFRATLERREEPWQVWPERLRAGELDNGDFGAKAFRYHLYAQWVAHEQMTRLAERAEGKGVRLYLDLPLGVRADGFDGWRDQELFAFQASGGAPPDPVFTQGQDWGFPPMHPRKLRQQKYRYPLEYLRHHLRCARMLRLDHAMSLHRLYWVPKGAPASEGAYVRYALDEWCALLCLESHRHRAILVGENLGTVPPEVNDAMAQHQLRELFVVQYEQQPKPTRAMRPVPQLSVASLNTHDMPPFTAHSQGLDIADRADLGLLTKGMAKKESLHRDRLQGALTNYLRRQRRFNGQTGEGALLEAVLTHLAASKAETVLVNLEDLWLETAPQNVPGTFSERVNWRRKGRLSLEQLMQSPRIQVLLARLNQVRRTRPSRSQE